MPACSISYKFDRFELSLLGLAPLPLPAIGGGWTDCVLLDEQRGLRVMQNSRGDTLILQRSAE